MISVERITNPLRIVELWDVFRDGLAEIVALTKERMDEQEYFRMLINIVERPDVWVGVCIQDNTGGPLSYGICMDSTLPFSSRVTYSVISFYAMPGRTDATEAMMTAFESWARGHGVKSYTVTTRRFTGAAVKCFSSGRYGLRVAYRGYEKNL